LRIRWKLFWLLAVISLAPLLALRINSQLSLDRLANRLYQRVSAHLMDEAQQSVRRLVEDHARLLVSRRETLALAVSMQALAARQALAVPAPPLSPDQVRIVAAARGMGMGARRTEAQAPGLTPEPGYTRQAPDGTVALLPIDRDRLGLRLPQDLSPEAAGPRLDALAVLLAPLRQVADRIGPLAHFQIVQLTDGLAAVYPALGGMPRQHDPRQAPWYLEALARTGPVWTAPQVEPGTNRVAVAVSQAVPGPDGALAGVTVIFTPLEDLLASVTMPGHIPGDVESFLIVAETTPTGASRLLAEAGQVRREHGRAWHAFVTPAPLDSPDTDVLAAMADDVAKDQSGVRRLVFHGRDSLAAYAPTAAGEALVQISSVAAVLAEDQAVADDVARSIKRLYLFGTLIVGTVMLALVIVSLTASRAVTRPILALTQAAGRLAVGDFSARVDTPGHDEIGELGRMFNGLAPRLEAHVRLSETMALASEIQRSLLPAAPPAIPGLALAAVSRYCDETGGDYYDFFPDPGGRPGRLGLVVGDVTGHGLEAALLMTTARALLRPRVDRAGSPAEILADVNRDLVADVYGTGRFMTLFYLEIDPKAGTAVFARAGHDPALLYDPATGAFTELSVRGMALGVSDEAVYETGSVAGLRPGQVLLVGSDGLWEARNPAGEMFGKARTRAVLANAAAGGAETVRDALLSALDTFRGEAPLEDDVTLVVAAVTE
jgi:phosphoserine phosphatase RsbU/P